MHYINCLDGITNFEESKEILQKKGLVKIKNFQNKEDKIGFIQYVITPKGISERTKLTINFMKRKMQEYDELKKELKKNK